MTDVDLERSIATFQRCIENRDATAAEAVLHPGYALDLATALGEDRSGTFVISGIWLQDHRGWRIWRRHSTPLTAGRMPGTGNSA